MSNSLSAFITQLTERGVSAKLNGFFNTEGGFAEVASKRFLDSCVDTEDEGKTLAPNCESGCGRRAGSYIRFPSGDGDGIYAVVELSHGGHPIGCFAFFDSMWSTPYPLVMDVEEDNYHGGSGVVNLSIIELFAECSGYDFGGIQVSDSLHWAEFVTQNSHEATTDIHGLEDGRYQVVGFCEPWQKSLDTSGEDEPEVRDAMLTSLRESGISGAFDPASPRPRVVFVVADAWLRSEGIQLSLLQVDAESLWLTNIVTNQLSHIEPETDNAIAKNVEYRLALGDTDSALAYMLVSAMNGYKTFTEVLGEQFDYVSTHEHELLALRGMNQPWADWRGLVHARVNAQSDPDRDYTPLPKSSRSVGLPNSSLKTGLSKRSSNLGPQNEPDDQASFASRFCPQCGQAFNDERAKFCSNCGTART